MILMIVMICVVMLIKDTNDTNQIVGQSLEELPMACTILPNNRAIGVFSTPGNLSTESRLHFGATLMTCENSGTDRHRAYMGIQQKCSMK